MDDLIKSAKAQLYERISSPLLFSLFFSWVAWNYRLVLIAISSMTPSDKFMAIELLPLAYDYSWLYKAIYWFIGPAATAAIYIFAYPIPAKIVYKYTRNEQKKLKEIQQQIEDDTPLTMEEARKLRTIVRQVQAELEQTLESRDAEISRLKTELSALTPATPIKRRPAPSQKTVLNLPVDEEKILQFVAERNDVNLETILTSGSADRMQAQYYVDELVRKNLIYVDDVGLNQDVELTPTGRAFLVEKRSKNKSN